VNNYDINPMTNKMAYNPLANNVAQPSQMPSSMMPSSMMPSSIAPSAMPAPCVNINPASPLSPTIPSYPVAPMYPIMREGAPAVTDADYIPGFLASMIGRSVRAEFLLGTSQYVDKTGILVEVGVNFFVLQDVNSRTNTMCDLYSVKFVTILYG